MKLSMENDFTPRAVQVQTDPLLTLYNLYLGPVRWRISWTYLVLDFARWGGELYSPCCYRPVHMQWLHGRLGSESLRCSACNQSFRGEVDVLKDLLDGRRPPWVLAREAPASFLWWLEEGWNLNGLESQVWLSVLAHYLPPDPEAHP